MVAVALMVREPGARVPPESAPVVVVASAVTAVVLRAAMTNRISSFLVVVDESRIPVGEKCEVG